VAGRSSGGRGTVSSNESRTVGNSARTGTDLKSIRNRDEVMTTHSVRRSFSILIGVTGSNIVQVTGNRITVLGRSVADTMDTVFPMNVSADTLAGIMGSESASSRSWWWADTRVSNIAATGSVPSTHGRNTGETTGMTRTTSTSIT